MIGKFFRNQVVWKVYVHKEVVKQFTELCHNSLPNEGLAKLYGLHATYKGKNYSIVSNLATGDTEASPTSAHFTNQGLRECYQTSQQFSDYQNQKPYEIGIAHSHPFPGDPEFSHIDNRTFLSFPNDRLGNVFILTNPLEGQFKVFTVEASPDDQKYLEQQIWTTYE